MEDRIASKDTLVHALVSRVGVASSGHLSMAPRSCCSVTVHKASFWHAAWFEGGFLGGGTLLARG